MFQSPTLLTDEQNASIQRAALKIGIMDPVEVVQINVHNDTPRAQTPTSYGTDNLNLISSRHLGRAPNKMKALVEQDEDEWRDFLSQRAKQEIQTPDDAPSGFACLYDVELCGESRLSELLTMYDRVDILPPINKPLDWCEKHQVPLSDLQELARLKRIRIILPHSLEKYNASLVESVAEVDPSSLVLSRALATKTIIRGQAKEPLLYAPLTAQQRATVLSALSKTTMGGTYRELLKSYGELLSGQHDLYMMRGAIATFGFGVGAYLGKCFQPNQRRRSH